MRASDTSENVHAAEVVTRDLNAGLLGVFLEGKYTDGFLEYAGRRRVEDHRLGKLFRRPEHLRAAITTLPLPTTSGAGPCCPFPLHIISPSSSFPFDSCGLKSLVVEAAKQSCSRFSLPPTYLRLTVGPHEQRGGLLMALTRQGYFSRAQWYPL